MAYTLVLAVGFGSTKAGLTTVGYQLKNADGTNNGTRVSGATIKEIGSGYYQATVSIPDGHSGGILWDTGEGTPKYSYQEINPNTGEYVDAKMTSRPTASAIDTTLTASHGSGSWQTGVGTGSGTNTVTVTLQEALGTPKIPNATVAVKNQAGDTLLATGTTDSNGQVQFLLDNGTYTIYKQKLGSYSFTNPETLVVSGNTNASYIGTPISVSAPTQANTCRIFIWAKNPNETLMTSLEGTAKVVVLPFKYNGSLYRGASIAFQKHNDGYWYIDIVYGVTVDIHIREIDFEKRNYTVPSVPTQDLYSV